MRVQTCEVDSFVSGDRYEFKPGLSYPVDPQVLGQFLQNMPDRSPPAILKAAIPIDSVLHPCIDWDEQRSIERDRLSQARRIPRSLTVVRVNAPPMEAFIHVPSVTGNMPGFYATPAELSQSSSEWDRAYGQITRQAAALESLVERLLAIKPSRPEADRVTIDRVHRAVKEVSAALAR